MILARKRCDPNTQSMFQLQPTVSGSPSTRHWVVSRPLSSVSEEIPEVRRPAHFQIWVSSQSVDSIHQPHGQHYHQIHHSPNARRMILIFLKKPATSSLLWTGTAKRWVGSSDGSARSCFGLNMMSLSWHYAAAVLVLAAAARVRISSTTVGGPVFLRS